MPRHSFMVWLAAHARILIEEGIASVFQDSESCCYFRSREIEACRHIFFRCGFTKQLWNGILQRFRVQQRCWSSGHELNSFGKKVMGESKSSCPEDCFVW